MITSRSTWIVTLFAALLSGCTVNQSIGDSFGSAVRKPHGQEFAPVTDWNKAQQALLYVYRPVSQWSNDEFESPSFNVNGKRVFNIKGGAYTWYLLEPGFYDIVMRRGVLGFEGVNNYNLSTITEMHLEATPGKVFYLRYSEIDTPDENTNVLVNGPLQAVSAELALAELKQTKLLHRSGKLLAARAEAEPDSTPAEAVAPVVATQPALAPVVKPAPAPAPKLAPAPKPTPTPAPKLAPAPKSAPAPAVKPEPEVVKPAAEDSLDNGSFEGSLRIVEPAPKKKPWWKFW